MGKESCSLACHWLDNWLVASQVFTQLFTCAKLNFIFTFGEIVVKKNYVLFISIYFFLFIANSERLMHEHASYQIREIYNHVNYFSLWLSNGFI